MIQLQWISFGIRARLSLYAYAGNFDSEVDYRREWVLFTIFFFILKDVYI